MSEASTKPDGGENAPETTACCGPEMAKMVQECPCASAMKSHPKTALLGMSIVFLALLISQVGGILGIVAFFRTF